MLEQHIYNKRIVELMKKKTSLIEALNKLLEATNGQKVEAVGNSGPDLAEKVFAKQLSKQHN